MSRIEKLFIPQPNGDIDINKVELSRHKFLKPILTKGRRKENIDTMMYVYLMADIGSIYNHLQGKQKEEAVKNHFGYDDKWKPTPDMELAIQGYSEIVELTPTGRAYLSASKALFQTGKDLDRAMDNITMLKGYLETRINKIENDRNFTEVERMDNIKEARAFIAEIATTQKTIITSIKELPSLLSVVSTLAESFAEENSTEARVHGGGTLGNRE